MNITNTISLDFGRETLPIRVFAKQGDVNSRIVEITPLNLGLPMTIPAGTTARLQATKPDSTQVVNDCTISDGKIYAELTAQIQAVAGIVVAEIGLYNGDTLLSSQIFYVNVKESAYNEDVVLSSNEFKSLVEAFNAVDNINALLVVGGVGEKLCPLGSGVNNGVKSVNLVGAECDFKLLGDTACCIFKSECLEVVGQLDLEGGEVHCIIVAGKSEGVVG